jgi:hypothetical protein
LKLLHRRSRALVGLAQPAPELAPEVWWDAALRLVERPAPGADRSRNQIVTSGLALPFSHS